MLSGNREFQETELTKTIVSALKIAVREIENLPRVTIDLVNKRKEMKDIINRIESEKLDVAFNSREY